MASRVQYALTLSGAVNVASIKDNNPQTQQYTHINYGTFCRKYGISKREQDVFSLLVNGKDTSEIAKILCISDNTVKSHVRQLLRKTESRNRIFLSALFFRECRENEANYGSSSEGRLDTTL